MRRLQVLTNSSINTFRRCPREYYFRYVLNRKARRKANALRFGSLIHIGLNEWWRRTPGSTNKFVGSIIEMRRHVSDEETDEFDLVKAECLIAGYTTRWGDEPYETVAVEKIFSMPLHIDVDGSETPSLELSGSIDAICRIDIPHHAATVYNVEHKTTSSDISPGSDYWRHVTTLDSQVSTYATASRSMGYDIRGTIYDVIRKPEILPLKATPEESKKYTKPTKSEPLPRLYANQRETDETPEEYRERLTADIIARPDWYFARQIIVRLDTENESHAQDVRQTAQMISVSEDHSAWPRSPGSCKQYGRWCDFHPVCSGESSIDDGTRYEHKAHQHEELGL